MTKEQEHIEKIRKEKFWLNEEGQLREKNPLIDDLINSIEHLSEGLYSKDTHFIFELIQNTEDNTYHEGVEPSLSFCLVRYDPTNTQESSGALIIQNNEVGFSADNVDAICAIGKTTKSKIRGYIGEKGIGFKSVFKITIVPHIFSNGYQFCFPEKDEKSGLGYIVPYWVAEIPQEIDPNQTTIILPLNKKDFGYEKIKEMLQDIEPETILFLSKLKEIHINTDDGDDFTILKDDARSPHIQILIEGTKQGRSYSEVREFLLFTRTFDRPKDVEHEKRKDIDERDVTIAFPIDDNKSSMGKIFAYLPVRSDTGLPFLINADFILPSSREDILDVPWNRWLMKCVADLLGKALPLLKKKGLLTVKLLEKLAKRINELDETSIFYPIVETVRHALLNQELLPADDGTFVSAQNAKLARRAKLRKLLTHNQLRELLQSDNDTKWLSGEITKDRTPNLHSYLIKELDVEEITPARFARKITVEFLKNQTNEGMINFYQFLNDQEGLWKKATWYNPDGPLRSKPFIRLQDGTHVPPFKEDGSPNAYLPPENDTKFQIVSREIVKDEKALEFLKKKLELTEPDMFAEVIEHVHPKYVQSNPNISKDEHLKDIEKIIKAYKTSTSEKQEQLIEKLKDTHFVRAENLASRQIEYKKPGELYFKSKELITYFNGNEGTWFVSSEYDDNLRRLLNALGVTDKIRIRCKSMDDSVDYVELEYRLYHRRGLKGFDPDIQVDGLEHAITNPTVEKSKIIWNKIAAKYRHCIKGKILISSRQDFSPMASTYREEEVISSFGHLLRDSQWLPDKQGNFHKPAKLKLDDLPESFIRDERLADQLDMEKDIVAKLAEKLGVDPEDIELLRRHPKEFEQWKATLTKKKKPTFPQKISFNPERRQERLEEQISKAPEKEYEARSRSVRVSANIIDKETYLRNSYTNDDGQMVCQICKEEMPFKKRDGEYYFEAVEALSRDYFAKEHGAQFLALCPLCAAMYKEFIKQDEEAMESFKNALVTSEAPEIPIQLGELNKSVRFVESHFLDIRTIIEARE